MVPEEPSLRDGLDRRTERIFLEAIYEEDDEDRRRAIIERRCGDDGPLRESVLRLLEACGRMGDFLGRPPLDLNAATSVMPSGDEPLPARIGNYAIVRVVGAGGMGVVYEARQENPCRRIALKVQHPGLVSPQWLRRFRREAEVLGQLQHPGIATVHEAGEGAIVVPGRPTARLAFLAMEYVDGVGLRAYADAQALDPRARLELVARVCDAMQHAHQRGVVHRDLKPSNILVDATGQPKVLDFGIALATGPDWEAQTLATRTGQFVGTIPYMSPEQLGAGSGPVDARSDIYALGVILFQLLSDRLPVETRDLSLPEAIRAIREDEPSSLGSLNSAFRGDVNAIVARALRKEPERRYATAAELGSDIRRHLRGEPIRARRATTWYRLHRFVRRNKMLVVGVAGTVTALLLGLVLTTGFARRELQQRRIAEAFSAEAARAAHAARLTAAIASLDALDPASAARSLDAVAPERRAWEWRHLRWRAGRHLAEIPPPREGLFSLSVAQRSSIVFIADGRGAIRAWSLDDGRLIRELATEPFPWRGPMVTSPDGSVLIGDCADRVLSGAGTTEERRLVAWDAHSGRELWRRPGAFSMGRELWRRPGAHRLAEDAFHPDGSLVAVGPWGGRSILLLDPRTGDIRETLNVSDDTAREPRFSPDGKRLVYRLEGGSVVLDRETGRTRRLSLDTAMFADGGDAVLAHDGAQAVHLNLRTGARSPVPHIRPVDWSSGVSLLAIGEPAFDSPNRRFLVPDATGTVVRRLLDGTVTARLGNRADPLGWSGDGTRIATIDEHAVVRIWDAAGDSRLARIPAPPRRRFSFFAMAPAGGLGATTSWGFVTLYDLGSGTELWHNYELEPFLHALAFAPDARWLAAGGDAGDVTVLDVATGQVVRRLPVGEGQITALAWLPDGQSLLVVSRKAPGDGVLRWIDAATGESAGELMLPGESYHCVGSRAGLASNCIGVSADGRRVAVAGRFPAEQEDAEPVGPDAGVAVWDLPSGRRLGVFRAEHADGGDVALDADGTRVALTATLRRYAAGAVPDELIVWDVATHETLVRRSYERVALRGVTFSPEGDRVVLGVDEGLLHVVDVAGELDEVELRTGKRGLMSLDYDAAGRTLAVGLSGEIVLFETGAPQGGLAARGLWREARTLVDAAHVSWTFAEDVERALRADTGLPDGVRLAALELVRVRGDHPGWLVSDATIGYRATALDDRELRSIVRKAELARRLRPDHADTMAVLGKCRYREGDYADALRLLEGAAVIYRTGGRSPTPEDLAFVAMTHWRLGDRWSAGAAMRDLDALLASGTKAPASGALACIEEARRLTGAPAIDLNTHRQSSE